MRHKNKAFTLIELLVVIAIIAMLVSILTVGTLKVKIISKNLRQKGEFHGMEISLELFSSDFSSYPDSHREFANGTSDFVCGGQILAEAMLGRDERGFHPRTKWHPGREQAGLPLYFTDTTLKERKQPYFELKHTGFYTLDEMWGSFLGTELHGPSPILTDVFNSRKITVSGQNVKVGSPVLYFRADPTKRFRVDENNKVEVAVNGVVEADTYSNWIYNLNDNWHILKLPWLSDPETVTNGLDRHYKDLEDSTKSNAQVFYEKITQRQEGSFYKPHNKNTFLLISAGNDGVYGTKDDLTNFNY